MCYDIAWLACCFSWILVSLNMLVVITWYWSFHNKLRFQHNIGYGTRNLTLYIEYKSSKKTRAVSTSILKLKYKKNVFLIQVCIETVGWWRWEIKVMKLTENFKTKWNKILMSCQAIIKRKENGKH